MEVLRETYVLGIICCEVSKKDAEQIIKLKAGMAQWLCLEVLRKLKSEVS